ncbi:MAG TPA: choice-of-anchor tandem repeat GloVer-containing protein [Candidatus Dormibacteraeota bacterium]|nr:choice-of-anchor tandem repeat GloVer-containing protein [Candidatus Dormibacteraeota bacterium]
MLKLRTFGLAFRSKRSWKADSAADFRLLKMARIVSALWVAAAAPAAGQGFTVIHDFAGYQTQVGAEPFSAPIQGTDGNFYGTTASGGGGACTFGCGTIYKITADGAFTVLYSFQEPDWGPDSGLIQASDGNFYGTTAWGGGSANCYQTNGCGTIYEITPAGVFSTRYSFNEAAGPSQVIQASNGNFYGSTYYGGSSTNCYLGCGTIFQLTPGGTLTTVYSFGGSDGSAPSVLIQATDGNFYGTTLGGGAGGEGTIFKLTVGGILTTLYSFSGADGFEPASLIQARSGNFYGVTVAGGANNGGTVFEITSAGTLTSVYSFCAQKYCGDGNEPSTLMQASDGNLYGTTLWGGNAKEGGGTIFEVNGGTVTTIYKFITTGGSYLSGQGPQGLVQAAVGNFYGTTVSGGTNNNCGNSCGTIFSFGPATATLSRTSFKFGDQALNETSVAESLTLKNSGVTLLNITNVALSGGFAIATNTCAGVSLTLGKQCTVSLTFTPAALGLQTGTLSFTDNAGNSPQTITVSGTGVEPATLTPTSATYAKQVVGTTSIAKTFTLYNYQNLTLTGIAISTTGDFAVSTTTCSTNLAAKKGCKVSVTFTPTQIGTRTGTLSLSDSAGNSPQTATLTGTGTN